MAKDTSKENESIILQKNQGASPLAVYTPGKTIFDDATGEELNADELFKLVTDPSLVKGCSLLGFLPPLCGNFVVGKLVEAQNQKSAYSPDGRVVYLIDGLVKYYNGDSAAFTKQKIDPPFKEADWSWARGAVYVGHIQGLAMLPQFIGRNVRILFGPYQQSGSRTKKRVSAGFVPTPATPAPVALPPVEDSEPELLTE